METQIKLVEFQGQISKCVVIKDLKINRRTGLHVFDHACFKALYSTILHEFNCAARIDNLGFGSDII